MPRHTSSDLSPRPATAHPLDRETLWEMWADGTIEGLRNGLIRHLQRKLPFVGQEDVFAESVTEEAFDQLIDAVSRGLSITNPSAWMYKVTWRIAQRRLQMTESISHDRESVIDILHGGLTNPDTIAYKEHQHAALVKVALNHAHRLLPRIGTGQVLRVMDLFLEAVESGIADLPPSVIADTIGISVPHARTLLHRGLSRLRREAAREGIELPSDLDPSMHDPYGEDRT